MVDKQSIIFLYRRGGQSLREISKTLNLHRATVTKVIREYEESLKADNPDAALDTVLTTLPEYKSNDRSARVVKGEVAAEIDKWLAENERREIFCASRFDGLSHDEIAAKYGYSARKIRREIGKVLEELRIIFSAWGR